MKIVKTFIPALYSRNAFQYLMFPIIKFGIPNWEQLDRLYIALVLKLLIEGTK